MSDPVTNTEIEDVLTSIRRLVSENRPLPDAVKDQAPARPVAFDTSSAQDESAEDETPVAEAPLALVLTPALRVEDAPDAEGDVDADEPQDVVDESDDLDEVEIDPSVDVDQVAAKVEPDAVEAVDAEQDQVSVESEEVTLEGAEASLDEVMVEVGSGDEAVVSEDEAPLSFEAVSDTAPEEAMDEEQPFDFKQVLEARIHQFRDATSTDDVTYDPEVDAAPDMADAVMDELRAHMPEEIADAAEIVDAEALSEAMEEAAEIDEAMLREMVADIVRQELQGALGERITRNVRKLVRREIHRALAAHDLG
ncbi:hypothetical protein [Shimia sp.]|jgi:hypothetical protein|uniref:hypothetical protein n=1 Tax=unclassified Shimia TaxID=2630038 RepID=UPI0025FB5E5E|nr:hypothetical protein [Shimia sp.]MCH2068468.1 hypothetical protein [Shimia sp.]